MRSEDLETALHQLYDRETAYQTACEEEAEAEHAYKMKQAREFLDADGPVDVRKATALVACNGLYLDYLKKAAVKDFTKEKLRDSQQALSARQSLLTASVKSDFGYSVDRRIA